MFEQSCGDVPYIHVLMGLGTTCVSVLLDVSMLDVAVCLEWWYRAAPNVLPH